MQKKELESARLVFAKEAALLLEQQKLLETEREEVNQEKKRMYRVMDTISAAVEEGWKKRPRPGNVKVKAPDTKRICVEKNCNK